MNINITGIYDLSEDIELLVKIEIKHYKSLNETGVPLFFNRR